MTFRELVASKNVTQSQLAAAVGVSQATMSLWMNGDRWPDMESIYKISKYLKSPIDDIVEMVTGGKDDSVLREQPNFRLRKPKKPLPKEIARPVVIRRKGTAIKGGR